MKTNGKKTKKLVAAMSGGVDSSVAAAIMLKQGYDVVGVTLKFIECDGISEKKKSCCGTDDKRQVLGVCEKLGIQHHFLDMRELFEEKVLKICWEEYSRGRTPNPCVLCNRHIKFRALLEYASSIGAEGIVTGHYAKIAATPQGVELSRGADSIKDQSYFLSLVRREDLSRTFTPLDSMEKSEVRSVARELGLPNAEKKESQDACVGLLGENFAETLRIRFGGEARPGNFIDEHGLKIGEHEGIHNFTIGQRRGFGRGFGKPMFVKGINPETSEVSLGADEKELFSRKLSVSGINWLLGDFSKRLSFEAFVQIRYRSRPAKALVRLIGENNASVEFDEPQRAITPGQTAVLYDGKKVIAGGTIE